MAGLTASADGFMSPTPAPSGVSYYHPYLRGFGLTRFLSQETLLDGRGVALAHDAIDLANVLNSCSHTPELLSSSDQKARRLYKSIAQYLRLIVSACALLV